ncbi:hypothetical protein FNF27_00311 [Cafeteria roenbergensis]|uniref:Uncharacterized protein n=1 Tax=Cafeteria roenbergensis TaxID=33653 RepID=A0A5A8E1V2_CAFRO|nr:hypothetical protein FNF29_01445 [Cafeteria roenbergensis]KAA0163580.1 hypothetical protein FNF31_02742 [Cafeteria roenbergensis]KAA0171766.1 hypothetical protein FNF28_00402 [Cafeteria roenbergensis]KAA0178462.1 hypothetical protein FNF27_00311 [Cafeteria roenbergensis]|eukprot:KAA0156027.1 hypothetical protein FNF29_01445 [Cafeteria roenbergensis]
MELVERQLGMITGARSRRRASVASVLAVSPSAHKLEGNAAFSSLIESFLAAVKVIGDRTPTDREIETTRKYLELLEAKSAEDHLRAVDELLFQAPTEFIAATRALQRAERFVFAAASGQLDVVDAAIVADFQLIHAVDRDGHTALMAAAATDQEAVIRLLAERGANMNVQDYEGMTALHAAVEAEAVAAGMALLSLGADPCVVSSARQTPLDVVATMQPKQRAALRSLTFALLKAGGKGADWAALVEKEGLPIAVAGTAKGAEEAFAAIDAEHGSEEGAEAPLVAAAAASPGRSKRPQRVEFSA